MERAYIKDLKEKVGQEVKIAGFVDIRRDHGKLIFIDLRDVSGKVQMVILPNHKEAHEMANAVRPEWVLEIKGKINKRPDKLINDKELNGAIEVEVLSIEVINKAETPPFDVRSDGMSIGEETRFKYRYLDLRRPRMQRNMKERSRLNNLIRQFLISRDFIEIETPLLTKSTPEGARDYLVPSRIDQGKFYALPQSPQQYKQLLMIAGLERYFQLARCMRDEDTRGDRQPEFTQLDLEMSYVEREDVMKLNEELIIHLVKEIAPDKKIQEVPFPRISYKEAMEKYGTDRPDLRNDKNDPNILAFCWIVDFPFFEKTAEGGWTFTHNPFSSPKPEHMEMLLNKKDISKIITTQYDVALNGFEVMGGSIRNNKPEAIEAVFEIMGHTKEGIKKNFGHMLEAYQYGAPSHGGIAWGLDRFIALLLGEPNIREVIAFPKTGEGRDLLMNAPSEVDQKQLKELGIRIGK